MITAVQTIMGQDCPTCRAPLTSVGEAVPGCGSCEWNLDAFPDGRSDTWFWRRIRRAERRAGFRSDRALAGSAEPLPIGGPGYGLLLRLSILLLLSTLHVAINGTIAAQRRAIELRADLMSAPAAGTAAALETLDTMTLLPNLSGCLQHHVEAGQAEARWRRYMGSVRERHVDSLPARRQLSMRTAASVFAEHPAAGRRHQWLSSRAALPPALLVEEAAGARLEQEIAPYAEFLHHEMLDRVIH